MPFLIPTTSTAHMCTAWKKQNHLHREQKIAKRVRPVSQRAFAAVQHSAQENNLELM